MYNVFGKFLLPFQMLFNIIKKKLTNMTNLKMLLTYQTFYICINQPSSYCLSNEIETPDIIVHFENKFSSIASEVCRISVENPLFH